MCLNLEVYWLLFAGLFEHNLGLFSALFWHFFVAGIRLGFGLNLSAACRCLRPKLLRLAILHSSIFLLCMPNTLEY